MYTLIFASIVGGLFSAGIVLTVYSILSLRKNGMDFISIPIIGLMLMFFSLCLFFFLPFPGIYQKAGEINEKILLLDISPVQRYRIVSKEKIKPVYTDQKNLIGVYYYDFGWRVCRLAN